MCQDFIDRITKMGVEYREPDGIQIGDANGNLMILDFLTEVGDDDSNASDKSFKHNELYQKEFDDKLKKESQFMKALSTEDQNTSQHEKQGKCISHEQKQNHFYKTG